MSVSVQFFRPLEFYPGEQIYGNVLFGPSSSPFAFEALRVEFLAKEVTYWIHVYYTGRIRHETPYTGAKIRIHQSQTLIGTPVGQPQYAQALPDKQYSFPFSFTIPNDALSSVSHSDFQNVGVVDYSIEVFLEHEGKRVVQAIQPIKVLSVLPSPPPPAPMKIQSKVGMLFKSKEEVSFTMTLDKQQVSQGDPLTVMFEIDNPTKESIEYIKGTINQQWDFVGNYGSYSNSTQRASEVADLKFEAKEKKGKLVAPKSQFKNSYTIPIPKEIHPSLTGTFMSCVHTLTFTAKCSASADLTISIPLNIISPKQQQFYPVTNIPNPPLLQAIEHPF